jgi:hypothetical protein
MEFRVSFREGRPRLEGAIVRENLDPYKLGVISIVYPFYNCILVQDREFKWRVEDGVLHVRTRREDSDTIESLVPLYEEAVSQIKEEIDEEVREIDKLQTYLRALKYVGFLDKLLGKKEQS